MKITIYTISDCYFSKEEKEYLKSHNFAFEERNLEENRDYLTEMLTISNNFAGTPVTKIEKDDGQIVVLKGFTEEEFNKTLEVSPVVSVEPSEPQITVQKPPDAPVISEPQVVQAPETVVPKVEPVATTPPPAPVSAPQVDLGSIAAQIEQLKKLQESLAAQTAAAAPQPAPVTQPYQPPAPQQVQPQVPPAPVVPAQQPVQQAAQPANVDDSLAAILAELQTKINSAPTGTAQTTPPTTN